MEPNFNISTSNPNDTALEFLITDLKTNKTSKIPHYLNNSFNINLGHYFKKIEIVSENGLYEKIKDNNEQITLKLIRVIYQQQTNHRT